MKDIKIIFNFFLKDKLLLNTYIILFVLINIVQIVSLHTFNNNILSSFSQLQISLSTAIFYFTFYLFLSYEYCFRLKKSEATTVKTVRFPLNQFVVLGIFNLATTAIYIIYNVGAYLSLNLEHNEFIAHIVLSMLINIFMTALLATFLGMLLAFIKRLIAYPLMILFVFLTSPIYEFIVELLYNTTTVNLYPIFDFFNIFTPSLFWTPNFLFGYSLLPYRIALMLMWAFAILGILIYKVSTHKAMRYVLSSLCVVLFATSTLVYFEPSSKLVMNFNPDGGVNDDFIYYTKNEQKNEDGGFEVLSYSLDMSVTNILNVTANLSISENLPEYKFTLYHGYKINSISDQNGINLNFKQDGDYFNVYNNSNVTDIKIEYSGYSPKFYSNTQGMFLPGFFPYYPHSGFKNIYYLEEQSFDKLLLPNEAEFDLIIKGQKQSYSNLEKKGDDSFNGKSRAVTIASGYVESCFSNGIEVIYPYLDTANFTPEIIDVSLQQFKNEYHNYDKVEKIIIIPSLNLGVMETVVYDNYITTRNLYELSTVCLSSEINPRKNSLSQYIELYENNIEMFTYIMEYEKSEEYVGESITVMIENCINKNGFELLKKTAEKYFYNDNDTRSIIEFLNDFYEVNT